MQKSQDLEKSAVSSRRENCDLLALDPNFKLRPTVIRPTKSIQANTNEVTISVRNYGVHASKYYWPRLDIKTHLDNSWLESAYRIQRITYILNTRSKCIKTAALFYFFSKWRTMANFKPKSIIFNRSLQYMEFKVGSLLRVHITQTTLILIYFTLFFNFVAARSFFYSS